MRQRNPMLHRANRDYDAVGRVTKHDESMRGDNTKAWERRCAHLLPFLRTGPKTMAEVMEWGRRYRIVGDPQRFGAVMAEECVFWLEARGRVERGDDRKWRIVGE